MVGQGEHTLTLILAVAVGQGEERGAEQPEIQPNPCLVETGLAAWEVKLSEPQVEFLSDRETGSVARPELVDMKALGLGSVAGGDSLAGPDGGPPTSCVGWSTVLHTGEKASSKTEPHTGEEATHKSERWGREATVSPPPRETGRRFISASAKEVGKSGDL